MTLTPLTTRRGRRASRVVLAAALSAALVAAVVVLLSFTEAMRPEVQQPLRLVVTSGPGAEAVRLDGAVLETGSHFITADAAGDGAVVSFWVNSDMSEPAEGEPDTTAPYDLFRDADGRAVPLDVDRFTPGWQVVHARAEESGTVVEATARFWVGDGGPPPADATLGAEAPATTAPGDATSSATTAPATASTSAVPPSTTGLALQVSGNPEKGDPIPLNGAQLPDGEWFVFLAGTPEGAQVRFVLSGAGERIDRTENTAPFDLLGDDDGVPRALDGLHGLVTVEASVEVDGRPWRTASASFSVGRPAAAAPPPVDGSGGSEPGSRPAPDGAGAGPGVPVGGFPGAGSTGVPDGVQLRKVGRMTVTQNGAVLDGLDMECLDVRADDVVVRNSRITCDRDTSAVLNDGERLVIEDAEIDGGGKASVCVAHSRFTLRRVDVSNCADGIRANGDVVVEASFVHSLARQSGSHNDAIQTTKGRNIRIVGNTLLPYDPASDDPMNAAYILKEDQGDISDVVFRGNYVNGGNYTLYIVGSGMTNLDYAHNRFGRDHRYGPVSGDLDGVRWTDNLYADNGRAVR